MIIAIDGTLASGKGTIARRLSELYSLPHMDTGQLYRLTGLIALSADIDFADIDALVDIAASLNFEGYSDDDLRTAEVGQAASKVAVVPEVRAALLNLQRRFALQPGGAVLDGRDIGTVVCPEADVKLWIDASVTARATRRWKELAAKGETLTLNEMIRQLEERDARDRTRKDAPMVAAADAVLIDTTHLSIDAAVDKARTVVDRARAEKTDPS
ncbi:MAG: (d)CMP kinase [Pseudomonadota bacterium]